MAKYAVIGNCQAQGMASAIKAYCPGSEVESHAVGVLRRKGLAHCEELAEKLATYDRVFSQRMTGVHIGPLATDDLSGRVPLTLFPKIAHAGFHPDIIYVTVNNKYVPNATGSYASAIAIAGLQEGLTAERTSKLFNRYTYEYLGYPKRRSVWDAKLRERFAGQGYSAEGFLARKFMHTVNHPDIGAIADVAAQALDKAQIPREAELSALPRDALAKSTRLPFYADLPGGEDYVFHAPAKAATGSLDLLGFVEANFAAYASIVDEIHERPVQRARAFIRNEVV